MTEQRQEFENALENIESKVIELFAMIGEDLPSATRALLSYDGEALTALIERDREIDALYREVEELVNRAILLQAPVASDLRFLLSALRIVPELERSHDLVVHIAARANRIFSGDLSPRASGLVEAMGDLASAMWRTAADAWYQRDRSAAQSLGERDEEMDDLHSSLIAELASGSDVGAGDDGDDPGRPRLRAARRARGQHRPPRRLPGRLGGHPQPGPDHGVTETVAARVSRDRSL